MEYEKMVLLIRAVDDLLKLNEALINLNRMGYQENFPQLDNIYEVIKSVIMKRCYLMIALLFSLSVSFTGA